jgi:hypothetical protein
VREDGRIVDGEEWQEKVYNREEWKKLLRTARNRCILHMPMEWNMILYSRNGLICTTGTPTISSQLRKILQEYNRVHTKVT